MLNLRRILFPTDFSDTANAALTTALRLADAHDAVLHMLHAVVLHVEDPHNPEYHFPDPDRIAGSLERLAEEKLDTAATGVADVRVDIVRAKRRGPWAGPTILEYAEEEDIDLIVMGTHGRRGLRRFIIGSVTEEVTRLAPCPVVTVRSDKDADRVASAPWILAAVDLSDPAMAALEHAAELANGLDAELEVLHVIERLFGGPAPVDDALGTEALTEEWRGAIRARVEQVPAVADRPVEIRVELGHPVDRIVQVAATRHPEFVVLGTHARKGLDRTMLGSVAEGVIRRSPCPVFLAKSFGKSLVPVRG